MSTSTAFRALTDEALLRRVETLVLQERECVADVVEHLTEIDRRESALDLADGATKREVMAIVARLEAPPAPERDISLGGTVSPVADHCGALTPSGETNIGAGTSSASAEIFPTLRHRFHFTGDDDLVEKVSRLRGLLRHKYPQGRLEDLLKEAVMTLLEKIDRDRRPVVPRGNRRQAGIVPKPRRRGSRVVPGSVKREVWARDEGRCAYVAADGRRCESLEALEYDHIVPWADGGRSDTAENIRLLCRAHNQRLGRKRFGLTLKSNARSIC